MTDSTQPGSDINVTTTTDEQIERILLDTHCWVTDTCGENAVKAIKKLLLEAQIDEMKLHLHEWELFGDRPPYEGELVSMPILLGYHQDRITQLTKEANSL